MSLINIDDVLKSCANRIGVLHRVLRRSYSKEHAKELLSDYYHGNCSNKKLADDLCAEDSKLVDLELVVFEKRKAVYNRVKFEEVVEQAIRENDAAKKQVPSD